MPLPNKYPKGVAVFYLFISLAIKISFHMISADFFFFSFIASKLESTTEAGKKKTLGIFRMMSKVLHDELLDQQ